MPCVQGRSGPAREISRNPPSLKLRDALRYLQQRVCVRFDRVIPLHVPLAIPAQLPIFFRLGQEPREMRLYVFGLVIGPDKGNRVFGKRFVPGRSSDEGG